MVLQRAVSDERGSRLGGVAMKLQTEITYEDLARQLDLVRGLKITHVQALPFAGVLRVMVEGTPPNLVRTIHGFYPEDKRPGREPDTVHVDYLKKKGTS